MKIKKYLKVAYLGRELDDKLSGEAMTLRVINKVNGGHRFLYRKNTFLALYQKFLLVYSILSQIR